MSCYFTDITFALTRQCRLNAHNSFLISSLHVAGRCKVFHLHGSRTLLSQRLLLSGHTTPCCWGGIRVGAPQRVSPGLWTTSLRAAVGDESSKFACGQGSVLLAPVGPGQHAERTATCTPSGKKKQHSTKVEHTDVLLDNLSSSGRAEHPHASAL